jgi:hypothetical protein
MLESDTNSTSMYPVLDRNSVLGLTELPDSSANRSKHTDFVQRHMVTLSYCDSVLNDENERLIKPLEVSKAMKNLQYALLA